MSDSILVRVAASERHHVMWDKLDADEGYAWWTMGRLPRRESVRAYFLCGEEIIGEASADVEREEGRLLWACKAATLYVTPVPFVMTQKQGWRYFREMDDPESEIFVRVMDALEEANDRLRRRQDDAAREEWLWEQTFGVALADEFDEGWR